MVNDVNKIDGTSRIIIILTVSAILVRGTFLRNVGGVYFLFLVVQYLSIIVMTFKIIRIGSFSKQLYLLFFFATYLLISIVTYLAINVTRDFIIPLIGMLNVFSSFAFWLLLAEINKNKIYDLIWFNHSMILWVGVLNAIIAIIQYYFSSDVFGLLADNIYTTNINSNITERAVSLIGSPQTLSIILGVALVIATEYQYTHKTIKIYAISIILLAGILTFSKMFILFVSVYAILQVWVKRRFVFMFKSILLSLSILLILIQFKDYDGVDRLLSILTIIGNLSDYSTYNIWIEFMSYDNDFFHSIFGHGLGVMSRGAQIYSTEQILTGSTESYLVQIYFELGLAGILVFLALYSYSIHKYTKNIRFKHCGILLIAFIANIVGSPAFYGFTTSFIMYSIISPGLYIPSDNKTLRLR